MNIKLPLLHPKITWAALAALVAVAGTQIGLLLANQDVFATALGAHTAAGVIAVLKSASAWCTIATMFLAIITAAGRSIVPTIDYPNAGHPPQVAADAPAAAALASAQVEVAPTESQPTLPFTAPIVPEAIKAPAAMIPPPPDPMAGIGRPTPPS